MRVVGVGFRAAAELPSLKDAVSQAMRATGLDEIDALATETEKASAPVFYDLAQTLDVPVICVIAPELAVIMTPTQSPRVQERFATGSLAEAAALAAAGPGARLVVERVISGDGMATAAIAEGTTNK